MSVQGRSLFRRFLAENGLSHRDAAEALQVSTGSVHNWTAEALDGDARLRPGPAARRKIAIWTGGVVPESAWLTEDELLGRGRLRRRASGEIAAVRAPDAKATG